MGNFGGIERVTTIIANELAEREHVTVYSLSLSHNGPNAYPLSTKINQSFLFEQKCSMKRALCNGALRKTVKYIKKNKIEVLIACGVIYFPLACIAAKLTGIKSVCWEHKSPFSKTEVALEKESRYIGAKLSSVNVLISETAFRYYNETYRSQNNWLIYNPAESNLFLGDSVYDTESCRFISVGRLVYQKNYPLLLDVASRVLSVHQDWTWDIFGDGREYDFLKQRIEEIGLNGRIILKGTVSDLYDRYPSYSAIVMTSRWEGFPMVLIEGAAKGLPMISFDIPTGPNEIILDGVNGYLIREYDADKMAEKIEEFIKHPDLREKMSVKSKETSKRFCVENTVNKWMDLFAQLCDYK